jgi:hypothetical protein
MTMQVIESGAETGSNVSSSDNVSDYVPSSPDFVCSLCGKQAKNARGASMHHLRAHPDEVNPWRSEATPRQEPRTRTARVEKGGTADLRLVQKELTESIQTIGAVTAALLGVYKSFAITCRATGAKAQVPKLIRFGPLSRIEPFDPPYIETTLGHVIVEDAPISAGIIMRYAAENVTLLHWVQRFNALCHISGDGEVVADHLAGLVHSVRPSTPLANWYLGAQKLSILMKVSEENQELQAKIDELQRQLAER